MILAINFELSKLTSRIIRSDIGTRIIKGMETRTEATGSNGIGNFLGWAFDGIASLGGFILSKIGGLFEFSWTKFWSWITATRQFLFNFNWNATDEELNASIKAQWVAIATQIGGSLGNAFGYIACGILPGMAIAVFNEPLGAVVLAKVGEEALEELLENLSALFNTALRLGTQVIITETFKNVRKLIKSNNSLVRKIFGKNAENAVKAWGAKDSKPWSFALNNEQFLDDKFGDEGAWREAAEEFQEEFDEACTEAGYVVANAIDTFLSAQMLARERVPILGHTRYVEITPNRENPDEVIVLGGSEELLKPVIIQYLATQEQFNGRDLGVIYGTPIGDISERRYRPEVVLKFYAKQNNNKDKGVIVPNRLYMQISFRLMNKTSDDFTTDNYLKTLANLIYQKFAKPPFKINKGKLTYTYCDFQEGYQLKLDVLNEAEARRIIKQVLELQSHTFNDDLFRKGSTPIKAVSTKPEKITIRNKVEELPLRGGQEGEVKFSYAYLNLGIALPPINLVDLTGKKKNVVYVPTK